MAVLEVKTTHPGCSRPIRRCTAADRQNNVSWLVDTIDLGHIRVQICVPGMVYGRSRRIYHLEYPACSRGTTCEAGDVLQLILTTTAAGGGGALGACALCAHTMAAVDHSDAEAGLNVH